MIAPDYWETQLLQLSDARCGFTEQEAFNCLGVTDAEGREAVRALLQSMAHRGRLRRQGERHEKVRVVVPVETEPRPPKAIPPRPAPIPTQGDLFRRDL